MNEKTQKKFELVKNNFIKLCEKYDIPIPEIKHSLKEDVCDFTGLTEVRLNIKSAIEVEEGFYGRHVFGHYVCGLEQTNLSDKIANLIAKLIEPPQEGE